MERSGVMNYFFTNHNVDLNTASWSGSYGGERPEELLRERTVSRVAEAKTLQVLALDHGVSDDISWQRMETDMELLNRMRREQFEAGVVLYGVVEFNPMTFFLQTQSNFRQQVFEEVSGVDVTVEEQQVYDLFRQYYHVYNNHDNVHIYELFIPYLPPNVEATEWAYLTQEEAHSRIWDIYEELMGYGDRVDQEFFREFAREATGEPPVEHILGITHGRAVGSELRILLHVENMNENEISTPFHGDFGFSVFKMIDTQMEVNRSFEEVYAYLFNIIMEQNFDEFLIEQVEEAEISIRYLVFNSIGIH
jgi:hypothetical protein